MNSGVQIYVCGQNAVAFGLTQENKAAPVQIALSAITIKALLQTDRAIRNRWHTTKKGTTPKTYTCRDVGVDCDWKTIAETKDEILATVKKHAGSASCPSTSQKSSG